MFHFGSIHVEKYWTYAMCFALIRSSFIVVVGFCIYCCFFFFLFRQTIPCIDDSSRSSYMADSNDRGIAAMTHSNRCISLIDTGLMKRVAEIDGLKRTVWTLCFHPFYPSLLATGNLGGTVCVFEGTVSILTMFWSSCCINHTKNSSKISYAICFVLCRSSYGHKQMKVIQ